MGKHVDTTPEEPGRRRLLRAGGAAVAGVVGAGMVTSIAATPASAADGDNLVLGDDNDAGTATTVVSSNTPTSTGATLALNNTNTTLDEDGFVVGSAPLQLMPNGDYTDGPLGSLGMSTDGYLWVKNDPDFSADYVRTQFNTTTIFPLKPQRVLDTFRNRTNIINPSGLIDGSNRLIAGKWLHLDLSPIDREYFIFGTVLFANIAVLSSSAAGWAAVVPYKGAGVPPTSTINFAAGQQLSNGFVVGLGGDAPRGSGLVIDAVSIYASVNVRVLVDITAVTVWDQGQINPAIRTASAEPQGLTAQMAKVAKQRGFNLDRTKAHLQR